MKRYDEIQHVKKTPNAHRKGPLKKYRVTLELECRRQKGYCAICQRAKLKDAPVIIAPDFTIKDCPACVEHYLTYPVLQMQCKIINVEVKQ